MSGDPKKGSGKRTIGYEPHVTAVRATLSSGDSRLKMSPESFRATMHVGATVVGPLELPMLPSHERYVPSGELGRGGMGRVDIVFDRVLGRYVAQKDVLEEDMAPVLVSEAQVGAQLEHPSIVPVYDLYTDEQGRPRYTMRVVKGRSLADILWEEGRPPLSQLLGILRQVCLAVDYAHSRGVVHRDLKPDNILVGSFGEVYVLDWGIAYLTEASDLHRSLDRAELSLAGTPAYMAPEQATAGGVAPPADIYALGAMLYEILTGTHPFAGTSADLESVRSRRTVPPPSLASPERKVPSAFDGLVTTCLSRDPQQRPTARGIADAIDVYLDGERERAEREREADRLVEEAGRAWESQLELGARAHELEAESEARLSELKPHDPVEKKMPAWELAAEGRRLVAQAAHELARAEIAYASALGRIAEHAGARAGLARLHYHQFLDAEADADAERMARHLELARSYDDGDLALELADEGELVVETRPAGVPVRIARYETKGLLLRPGEWRSLGRTPTAAVMLPSGSYLLIAEGESGEVRYPLRIERAKRHRLDLRIPAESEIPPGMILIAGGPFLAHAAGTGRLERVELPDFAISRYPVTMKEYAVFLSDLHEIERERRLPRMMDGPPLIVLRDGRWRISDTCVESEARKYVPAKRELDLPVHGITWYDALRYASWLSARMGRPLRLPTLLEWEKTMRGADGRAFPMATHLDPSFAKLRQSRPESSQPEPIGSFALDESPYGVRDLAGGVADWTATMLDRRQPPSLDDEGSAEAGDRQALYMGGHWGSSPSVRGAQFAQGVKYRLLSVGFRLAADSDADGSSYVEAESINRD